MEIYNTDSLARQTTMNWLMEEKKSEFGHVSSFSADLTFGVLKVKSQ